MIDIAFQIDALNVFSPPTVNLIFSGMLCNAMANVIIMSYKDS